MDPQDLEQLRQKLAELNQSFEGLGTNINKQAIGLEDVLGKKLPKSSQAAMEALKGLGKTVSDYNDAMRRGERGAKTAADGLGNFADTIQNVVNVLALFAPGGILVKGAIMGVGMLVKGTSEYFKAANKQADILFKTYKDLSSIGAAGEGLQQTFKNLQTIGLTTTEAERFAAAIKRAGADLMYMGYSMADGAKGFSDAVGKIYKGPLGRDLEMLGFEFEDLASSTATYVTLQGRLGRLQMKTQEDLMRETHAYALELDLLARLTGQSREEQQKAQRSLLEDERWVGFTQQAKSAGEDLTQVQMAIATLPADLQKGAQHIMAGAGAVSSEEARQTFQTIPEIYQILTELRRGGISATEANIRMMEGVQRFSEQTAGSRAVGATAGFGLRLGGQGGLYERATQLDARAVRARVEQGQTLEEAIKAEQDLARATKDSKNAVVDTERAQRNYQQNLDAFTNIGLKTATSAALTFAQALERGSRAIPGSPAGGRATLGTSGATRSAADIRAGRGAGGASTGTAAIRDLIGQAESKGNYNVMVGGSQVPLTGMSINEVLQYQASLQAQGKNTAAGKYQIINQTLSGLVSSMGIDPSAKFDAAMQDRLADELIRRRGYSDYTTGKISKEGFLRNLSMEWAGLPGSSSGSSYYAGVGNNRATVGWQQALDSFQKGGIFDKKEGMAQLHGPEAIVPLPDGRAIPVTFTGMSEQTSLLSTQISKLDELIGVMRNQLATSNKILQVSR